MCKEKGEIFDDSEGNQEQEHVPDLWAFYHKWRVIEGVSEENQDLIMGLAKRLEMKRIPCPVCGEYFEGHEYKKRWRKKRHNGHNVAVCNKCSGDKNPLDIST